jgi:hypothetical protein
MEQDKTGMDWPDSSSAKHLVNSIVVCEGRDCADEIFGFSCWSRNARAGISDALMYLLENRRDTVERVEEFGCILDGPQNDLTAQHARWCAKDDMRST